MGTELRQNPVYTSVYVVWSKLILTDLVPYFIILVLNSFIVIKIVKSSRFRAKILEARNAHQQEVSNNHNYNCYSLISGTFDREQRSKKLCCSCCSWCGKMSEKCSKWNKNCEREQKVCKVLTVYLVLEKAF